MVLFVTARVTGTHPLPAGAKIGNGEPIQPVAREPREEMLPAKPVEDRPGYVTSPYAPDAGYVDLRGFPAGTEVKCPFTGRIFLTPDQN